MFLSQVNTARFIVTGAMLRLFIGIGAVLFVVVFFAIFIPWLQDFRRELRYINMEIQRTDGRERAHWEKKKKRLWRSLLPFHHYH